MFVAIIARTETAETLNAALSRGVGANERAGARKEELRRTQAPPLQMFAKCRRKTCWSKRITQSRGGGGGAAPAEGPMLCSYVTSVLLMCNAA